MTDIAQLEKELLAAVASAKDEAALEAVRISALGKSGSVSALLKTLGTMTPDERKVQGPAINGLKDRVAGAIATAKDAFASAALNARLSTETVDVTLPVREAPTEAGRVHPISQVTDELTASPVQVRTMLSQKPPIRVICPGRTYRSDSDQTHTPMFHQVEGLVIDKGSHLGHLKWILEEFCKAFFEVDSVKMRFRPSFFPFTEPSLEVDIQCKRDKGEIRFGEGEDWLEILGCGMVHPNVLRNCGLDPNEYQGFAWGMGIDRIAMLKYGMNDLRAFFEADIRWLAHYGFRPLDFPTLAGGLSS